MSLRQGVESGRSGSGGSIVGKTTSIRDTEEDFGEEESEIRRRHVEVFRAESILIEDHGGTNMGLEKLEMEETEAEIEEEYGCGCEECDRMKNEDESFREEFRLGAVGMEVAEGFDVNVDVETGNTKVASGSKSSPDSREQTDVHDEIQEVELQSPHTPHSLPSPQWPPSPYPPTSATAQSPEVPSSPSALMAKTASSSSSEDSTSTRSANISGSGSGAGADSDRQSSRTRWSR